jgi:glutathione S-transferase
MNVININLKEKPQWFKKVSPLGKVPAVVHGDFVATESINLVNYLEAKHPYPKLAPATPEQAAMDGTTVAIFEANVLRYESF